ncbi:hypothetical protein [Isoalcanivorax beigongshangi]|uniref:Alginate export domain-containing protein n=1 Tax=Isoalcanivorax beigongshangi TaxID=3238810 RepID=A0ABV4AJ36_9GAMM
MRNLLNAGARLGLVGAALATLPAAVHAYTLFEEDQDYVQVDLSAIGGTFHSEKTYATAGGTQPGSLSWQEGYAHYGLSAGRALGGSLLEGRLSAVSSATWGDGDAAGFSTGDESRTRIEDAYLRWSSGDLIPWLGDNGLVVSAGRQTLSLGDGFLLGGDLVSMGRGLGRHFDRGGAYYLAGRSAFDQTATISLGGDQGFRGDLMWLKSDNRFQGRPEFAIANLEHVSDYGTVGFSYLRGLSVNRADALAMGVQDRDGMNVYSLRAQGNAGVENLFLSAEAVFQDTDNEQEHAWYAEVGWTFADMPGTPSLNYRYSRFSKDYDPLFYAFSRGFGTWFQGEVAGNYAGPFSTNTDVHHLNLLVQAHEKVAVGVAGFAFNTLDKRLGDMGGRELDLYLSWDVMQGVTLIPLVGIYTPDEDVSNGGNQLGDAGTNLYGQLMLSLSF